MIEKNPSTRGYREHVVSLKQDLTNVSAKVESLIAQHTAEKNLLDGARTSFALLKTALQHRSSAHTKHRENVSTDKMVVYTKLHKLRTDTEALIDWTQTSSHVRMNRLSGLNSVRVRLFVFQNGMTPRLQPRSMDSQEAEYLDTDPVFRRHVTGGIILFSAPIGLGTNYAACPVIVISSEFRGF